MRPQSRQIIHMGINYITLPVPEIDRRQSLRFQESLIEAGIDLTTFKFEENQILVQREPPFPREIRVGALVSQPQPLGQILVVASGPNQLVENFASDVEAILRAFEQTWSSRSRQVLSCDATLRCLYSSTSEHAFQELWEKRLNQPSELLSKLERKVLGGGLRFVMPTQPDDPESTQVELKVESFLRDAKKIFVEAQFFWRDPQPPGTPFNPTERLNQVNDYILNQVHAFLMEDES